MKKIGQGIMACLALAILLVVVIGQHIKGTIKYGKGRYRVTKYGIKPLIGV